MGGGTAAIEPGAAVDAATACADNTVRVCLHNANSFSLRAREYAWWLQQEEQAPAGPVLALLVTEPLILDEDVYLHDQYAVTPLSKPSALTSNPHVSTAIFYKVDSLQASITEMGLPFPCHSAE